MKILIVCWRLSYGGAERVGVSLANGFVQNGHQVTIVANLLDPITYHLDYRVVLKNLVYSNYLLIKWSSAIWKLRKYLKEDKPDVIIGILNATSLIAKIASWRMHIPVVMTEHDAFERPKEAPFTFWKKFAKFQLNKLYQHITILTDADKKVIGDSLKNVIVMPNPLAIEPLMLNTKGQIIGEDGIVVSKEKYILAAGRLEDWHYKGFDLLLQAWTDIPSSIKDGWKLLIAGKYDEEALKILGKYAKGNNVEFLGFRKDIKELMLNSSIFVLSSRYEGFGLVLIEAMSQGCACIAADYKGRQREIIGDEQNGMLVSVNSSSEIAKAIKTLITNDFLRLNMQKNAILRSCYYQLPHIIKMWENYLLGIINK